jgi:hypothetical protein
MPKQAETPAPITLTCNTILNGRFFAAGQVLPVARVEDLPPSLQPLVVTDSAEPEEENAPRGAFETGVAYEMTPDGRLGRALRRKVERQVAEFEAENEFEEQLEQAAADAELPEEIVRDLQEEHARGVSLHAAQLGAAARLSDDIADAAAEAAQPPVLLVKRGSRHYAPALKARLRPGRGCFRKATRRQF